MRNSKMSIILLFFIATMIGGAVWLLKAPNAAGPDAYPTLNEPISLPVANTQAQKKWNEYKNVMISFTSGAKSFTREDSFVVEVFKAPEDTQPFKTYTSSELRNMHIQTQCPEAMTGFMNPKYGDEFIFCNKSMDLDSWGLVKVTKNEKSKSTTTLIFSTVYEEQDLLVLNAFLQ